MDRTIRKNTRQTIEQILLLAKAEISPIDIDRLMRCRSVGLTQIYTSLFAYIYPLMRFRDDAAKLTAVTKVISRLNQPAFVLDVAIEYFL